MEEKGLEIDLKEFNERKSYGTLLHRMSVHLGTASEEDEKVFNILNGILKKVKDVAFKRGVNKVILTEVEKKELDIFIERLKRGEIRND